MRGSRGTAARDRAPAGRAPWLGRHDVGLAAGYSRGLAAHYFGSKSGLLREITRHINDNFFSELQRAPPARPGLNSLMSFVSVYLGHSDPEWTSTRALLLLMTEALLEDSGNAKQMERYNNSVLHFLEENIRAGIALGEIDPSISPRVGAEAVLGMLRGMMLQRLVPGARAGGRRAADAQAPAGAAATDLRGQGPWVRKRAASARRPSGACSRRWGPVAAR